MPNMKFTLRHTVYALIASALMLGGCRKNSADIDMPPQLPQDEEELNTIGYVALKLFPADGATRAVGDQFDYGDTNSVLLSGDPCHFLVFYNDQQATPIAVSAISGMVSNDNNNHTANSTVAFAAIAAKSEQKNFFEQLHHCLVLLNTNFTETQLWTTTKDQLLKTVVHSPFYTAKNGNRYFTMCNAVYVNGNQLAMDTQVDPTKVYSNYLEAIERAYNGEAAVVAYVERLAAKISVRFNNPALDNAAERLFVPAQDEIVLFENIKSDIPYYKGGYKSKIRITGWGMNALESSSFLFRNIKVNGNYFSNWFNTAYHRAYWSEDCNYTAANYPLQYRKAVDNSTAAYYAAGGNILQNMSYDDLNVNSFGKGSDQNGKALGRYVPENTFDCTDSGFNLDGRTEVLAGSHVIVCAELLTNLENPNDFKPYDIYRDRNGNCYRDELTCVQALVSALNNSLRSHSYLKYIYYDWNNGGSKQTLYAKTHGDYALYYNNTRISAANVGQIAAKLTADATVKNGDGQRLVWLDGFSIKDSFGKVVQIYSKIDEVDSKNDVFLRDATTNDIKSILLQYIGVIDHFKNGKMYYAVPVEYTTGYNSKKVYGMVRNCVYEIVINNVTGIGTSVDNDKDPIVPNTVSTHDHMYVSFEILRWHDVEQNVPGLIN